MNPSTSNQIARLLQELGWVEGTLVVVCVVLIIGLSIWSFSMKGRSVALRAAIIGAAFALALVLIVAVVLITD
jgi:hypothetical protein